MPRRRHLRIRDTESVEEYTHPGGGRGDFALPPRDRIPHANKLRGQLTNVIDQAKQALPKEEGVEIRGIPFDVWSESGFELWLESLEDWRIKMELVNARVEGERSAATVFVPLDKVESVFRKLDAYEHKDTKGNKPRNQKLFESIADIRVSTLRSFWTEGIEPYPEHTDRPLWWEVWLRRLSGRFRIRGIP